jgi:hypothetical protein
MELPITAAFCEKARTIFSHLLSFSSSQLQNCQFSNVQHHSAPLPGCHPPVEINPRVSDPQTTPGLFECPPRLEHGIANHCSILQHSVSMQEQFPLILFVFQNVPIISKP